MPNDWNVDRGESNARAKFELVDGKLVFTHLDGKKIKVVKIVATSGNFYKLEVELE